MKLRPCRFPTLLAVALTLGAGGCAELPRDIGLRAHRRAPIVAYWHNGPSTHGERRILINLTTQQAYFYRGKTRIGGTNISSGRVDYETPPGKYRVIQKDRDHVSSQYGVYVDRTGKVLVRDAERNATPKPKGAKFVGAPMPYFLRFTAGYGMHAGFVPHFRASHGCIRMPERMAKHFFEAATIGTRVEVIEPPRKRKR